MGRYELAAELSTGPLGPVWAARVTEGAEQGRIVAVRRVPVAAGAEQVRQQLVTAGTAAMAIRDSKIAAVLDVVPAPAEVCVVSEYVDGEPLHMLMEGAMSGRSPLPVPVAVAIVADALGAVRALRKRWIERLGQGEQVPERCLHGGLCPASLVVATFGDTMLVEPLLWGTAASVQGFGPRSRMTAYFAPEQLEGEGHADERSDVFSAGVMLWEMLANRPLFTPPRRAQASIPSLTDVERHGAPVPSPVKDIVARSLENDPAKRFATVDALIAALRSLPRDSVGSSEQIMVTLDRLARTRLEARRSLVAAAGWRLDSAPPESGRATVKPPPPAVRGQFDPATLVMNKPRVPSGFGEHEAPTLSRAKQVERPAPRPPPRPPPRPAATGAAARDPVDGIPPPPAILLVADAAPRPEVASLPDSVPVAEAVPAPDGAPVVAALPSPEIAVVVEPPPEPLAKEPDLQPPEASTLSVDAAAPSDLARRRSRGRKIVGLALGAGALVLVLALVVGRKSDTVEAGPGVSARPRPPATPARSIAPLATVPAPAAPSAEPEATDAATAGESDAASSPVAPKSAAPSRPQPVEHARPKHKPFRPTGI